jgi:release factor glutamine methyltransferase
MVEKAMSVVSSQLSVVGNGQGRATDYRLPTTDYRRFTILDLCTGSGCIALALAKGFPEADVYGIDISGTAIHYAEKNAWENKIDNVVFLQGSLFEPFKRSEGFDLIISNPPYIKTADINSLQPEVKEWEPVNALDGGTDGLDYYRLITGEAGNFLKDHGILMLELGEESAKPVAEMLARAGFTGIRITKDYAGIERIIQAEWTR